MNPDIDRAKDFTSFESSVYGVLDREEEASLLPGKIRLFPAHTPSVVSYAQTLLKPESVHQFVLEQWLRPSVVDPRVMQPVRFNQELYSASQKISNHREANSPRLKNVRTLLATLAEHRAYVKYQIYNLLDA